MTNNTIEIKYTEYNSISELSKQEQELIKKAIEGQKSSYAPYSEFNVGAAVLLDNGVIIKGSNQENAAYPSGICAERTAMFSAGIEYPNNKIVSIALVGGYKFKQTDSPVTPCGACRQVMAEYQRRADKSITVLMYGEDKIWKFEKVDDILPLIFNNL